jgi:hypothetical protein
MTTFWVVFVLINLGPTKRWNTNCCSKFHVQSYRHRPFDAWVQLYAMSFFEHMSRIGQKSASFELAKLNRPVMLYGRNLFWTHVVMYGFLTVGLLRIQEKSASFELANLNSPIMFYGLIFFEHGLLSIGKCVQTYCVLSWPITSP